jgi:hypothetical protein
MHAFKAQNFTQSIRRNGAAYIDEAATISTKSAKAKQQKIVDVVQRAGWPRVSWVI